VTGQPAVHIAAVCHLGFVKFKFLMVGAVKGPILHQRTKFRKDRSKPLRRYRDFCDFQDGGHRHLGFSKIRNFDGRSAVRGEFASPCQISSKSVKRLQRYGDLAVFKMVAVRHLGFACCLLGPPTMTSWWSLSLRQIWLKSMQ